MLTIAKFDRYDLVNNPMGDTASFTIWFSGCSMKCKKCHNRLLWDKNAGTKYKVDSVISIVRATCNRLNVKSVVLLGGEPLQQDRQELLSMCRSLKEAGLDIWLYTGYEFDEIDKELLQYLYTVKTGRYIAKLRQESFPASTNQRVHRIIDGTWTDITHKLGGKVK